MLAAGNESWGSPGSERGDAFKTGCRLPLSAIAARRGKKTSFIFPHLRNPGSFFTDATLLKKSPISSDGERYLEMRLGAQNVFNRADFSKIDNHPTDTTFAGVLGKGSATTRMRIMEVGARLFF